MDTVTARALNQMNRSFYDRNADAFSATRESAWPGWERLLARVGEPRRVLDVASGNLRFQKFLLEAAPERTPQLHCVDACPKLADPSVPATFQHVDVVEELLRERDLSASITGAPFDLAVSFGFMHHVPGQELRLRLLTALLDLTDAGGHVCVSFWRFMDERKLAAKARKVTERALVNRDLRLDDNDYLLGWQDRDDALRYCHSFQDSEIDQLVAGVSDSCVLADRYRSDGRNGAMNEYVILRRVGR